MEMYISAVLAMKIFRLIKIFSDSIKCVCVGGGELQKANIDTRDSVGGEQEMAEGKRQGIKDEEKKQDIQKTRNGKLFVDDNMYVDVLD